MTRFHAHRPFDFVEGTYPDGYSGAQGLGDGDVRDVQKKGGKIVVMHPDYELPDPEDARKQYAEVKMMDSRPTPAPRSYNSANLLEGDSA